MKFGITPITGFCRRSKRRCAAFTFTEVLAALAFLAAVVPVTLEGLRIANRASVVAERKTVAAQFGSRILNELIVTGDWATGSPSGQYDDEGKQYRWTVQTQPWELEALRLLTIEVTFTVQERDYSILLSTLVDESSASL